ELAPLVSRRNSMARCQHHDFVAPAVEERVSANNERTNVPLHEGGEGGVDLALGSRGQDMKLPPLPPHGLLQLAGLALGSRIFRVYQQRDHACTRNQLGE